ncbi:MAG: two-component regulator propeller domain-containing protein [Microscillaceae bacterium]|nr:two-component regulator propeller domain-containing protein [Microscillaceae bacterium]
MINLVASIRANSFFFILITSFYFLGFLLPFKVWAQKDLKYLDPHKKLTQYILDHWETDKGLPSGNIRRIFQSKEGFLWMASFDGLISFDGIRFGTYDKKNIPDLKSNAVYVIDESPDSTLWIGTQGSGLYSYKHGIFRKVGLEDLLITGMYVERNDRIWISGRGTGLSIFNPRKKILEKIDYAPLSEVTVNAIQKDKKGDIWFGTDSKGLTRLSKGKFSTLTMTDGLPSDNIINVFFDHHGTLWVTTPKGLCYLENKRFVTVPELDGLLVYALVEDASGSLWIATSSGLYRRNILTQKYELLPYQTESPVTNVLDLYLDKEGSLWIATYRNGLFRLKDGKFNNFTYQDGLATASVGSVCEYGQDKFLLGMNDGTINLLDQYKISVFPLKTPLPKIRVFNILKDKSGNLWISTFDKLLKVEPSGLEKVFTKAEGLPDNSIRVCFEDSQGNIWVGTRSGGVARISKNQKIRIFDTQHGLSSNFIMSISEDRQGNILVGTNDAGLSVIAKDGSIRKFMENDGLPSNLVFKTYTDPQNITWIVCNGGISRMENGKFFNFTSKDGLNNDSPFDFIEDNLGQIWLPTSRGIVKTTKKELNQYAQGKIRVIQWILYNKHDGMKSEDCTGAAHSIKSSQGHIWIPTNGGIVIVNPENIPINPHKPHITINSLLVNNQAIDIHKAIVIKPGRQRLVFDYSALSLLASSKIKFKYKLENFDETWNDVGSERQAVYTNLPPGDFVFRVIASNNDNIWNNEGTRLLIHKEPFIYQTYWFYGLCILFGALLIAGIFRWRIYSIQQRKRELEILVNLKTQEIASKNKELEQQKNLLQLRNQNITNSINYARRIQNAILPPLREIKKALPESFIIFKPRDIVSGDFYWFSRLQQTQEVVAPTPHRMTFNPPLPEEKIVIAAVDCTGHGVPGAFMSMIGNDLLNELVNVRRITSPEVILSELHYHINLTLKQQDNANKDGMEIGICVIDPNKQTLEFAGAKHPLYFIQDGEFQEIKGDRLPIGGYYRDMEADRKYHKKTLLVNSSTTLYLFSDGYRDQFGEISRRKFGRNRVRLLLQEIHDKPMEKQKEILLDTIQAWQGTEEQIDDIMVIGFRIGS